MERRKARCIDNGWSGTLWLEKYIMSMIEPYWVCGFIWAADTMDIYVCVRWAILWCRQKSKEALVIKRDHGMFGWLLLEPMI